MTDKEIIIDNIDVSRCEYRDWRNFCHCDNSKENEGEKRITGRGGCKYNPNCYYKQLKRKEQECEELHSRTASIIYSLTGGRLSYSTYTLEGCEQAYRDQLEIDVERTTKELQEELQAKEQECEELKQWKKGAENLFKAQIDNPDKIINRYKQALDEIRQYRVTEINDEDEEETDTILRIIDGAQND